MFLLKVVQVGTTDKLQFTIAYYCVKIWAVLNTATTIYSGCTSGYNRECSSFTSGYYCIRHGCFTSEYYSVIYYLIISDIRRTKVLGCISAMLPYNIVSCSALRVRPSVGQIIPRVWHRNSGCFTSGYHSKDLLSEEFRN